MSTMGGHLKQIPTHKSAGRKKHRRDQSLLHVGSGFTSAVNGTLCPGGTRAQYPYTLPLTSSMIPGGPKLCPWEYNSFHPNEITSRRHTYSSRSHQQVRKGGPVKYTPKLPPVPGTKPILRSDKHTTRLLDDWERLPKEFEGLFGKDDETPRHTQGITQALDGQGAGKSTNGDNCPNRASASDHWQKSKPPGKSSRRRGNGKGGDGKNGGGNGEPDGKGQAGVPGPRKRLQDNRDKFTCFWHKFDPISFCKCRYQYTTILHLWAHVKEHIGKHECDRCKSVFCPETTPRTTEWLPTELHYHDPETCSGHKKYGLITENTLKGLKADIDAMGARSRSERNSMSKEDREDAQKLLVERQYRFTYNKLFGGTRQVDPYWKESLHAELLDHQNYTLQHLGEISGTFLSEFYRTARAQKISGIFYAQVPKAAGDAMTPSHLTESSAEAEGSNDRLDASESGTTLINNTPESTVDEMPHSIVPYPTAGESCTLYTVPHPQAVNSLSPSQQLFWSAQPPDTSLLPQSQVFFYCPPYSGYHNNSNGDTNNFTTKHATSLDTVNGQHLPGQPQSVGPNMMPSSYPQMPTQSHSYQQRMTGPSSSSSSSWMPPRPYVHTGVQQLMEHCQQDETPFSPNRKRQRGEQDW